jgi:hypothetical protein
VTCSPKTVPPRVRLLWDNHNPRGGLFHEELTIQSGAGDLCPEASGVGHTCSRGPSQDGDRRADLLSLEVEVRRHGCGRGQEASYS